MITQILSSLMYSTQRRTVLEVIPPWLKTMWNKWDLRLSVLLSLFIHILLSILGSRRKYSRKLWIRISVWSAYTVADSVTMFAFGIISNNLSDLNNKNNCGHLGLNIELATVWAQFLLLHLGGPDSITAYALEDNELWLRHFVGLVIQTCAAIYLILVTWTGSHFSILSILMFIAGFIKYGERAWVLRAASSQIHRNSVQRAELVDHHERPRGYPNDTTLKREFNLRREEGYIVSIDKCPHVPESIYFSGLKNESLSSDEKRFHVVNKFFSFTARLFIDIPISFPHRHTIRTVYKNLSLEDAFLVNEIQIGMIYDLRYTKALLLHSRKGLWLRCITFFLTCCSLVFFSVLGDKDKYSSIDLCITFLLLVVSVLLEIYSVLMLIFSDRFSLWLIKHKKTSTFIFLNSFKLFKSPRWSNTMSQYTLIKPLRKKKYLLSCRGFPKIGKREYHEWDTQVTDDLKEMIFLFFKEKSEEVATTGKEPFAALPTNTIQEEEQGRITWEELIIMRSIATEVLYNRDREGFRQSFLPKARARVRAIKRISRYMLYFLVKYPSMISAETQLMVVSLEKIIESLSDSEFRTMVEDKLSEEHLLLPLQRNPSRETTLIYNALKLVSGQFRQSAQNQEVAEGSQQERESETLREKWERIGHTWMEILGYAAAKSKANEHSKQLRRGGEFFTRVWLIMAQLGLNHHFQASSPEGVPVNRLIAK